MTLRETNETEIAFDDLEMTIVQPDEPSWITITADMLTLEDNNNKVIMFTDEPYFTPEMPDRLEFCIAGVTTKYLKVDNQ
jgi:hypothetical protein